MEFTLSVMNCHLMYFVSLISFNNNLYLTYSKNNKVHLLGFILIKYNFKEGYNNCY